jgi:hypothetical protein
MPTITKHNAFNRLQRSLEEGRNPSKGGEVGAINT